MNLLRNFLTLNFAGDKNIGQLTVDLLKAIAMTARMNTLLNKLNQHFTYDSNLADTGIISSSSLNSTINNKESKTISTLNKAINAELTAQTKIFNDRTSTINIIDDEILDMTPEEAYAYKQINDYSTLTDDKNDASTNIEYLAQYADETGHSIEELIACLANVGSTIDTSSEKEAADEIDSLKNEFQSNIDNIDYNDYVQVADDIKTVRLFIQKIQYCGKASEYPENSINNIKKYITEQNNFMYLNNISENEIALLNSNLLGIVKYFIHKNNLELSPRDNVREIASCYFAGELKDDSGVKLTAKESSLKILGVLYEQVINYPKLDSLQGIMDFTAFKSPSFVETEQSVYVQIRTLNGEMKKFEIFLRKLFDRDAFPEMSIFALFLALIIDTAVVLLFILRGKYGPYGDTKLNSKRVIYLHTVESEKTPRKASDIVSGIIANIVGILIGIIAYIFQFVISQKEVIAIYLVIYLFAGLILANAINSLYRASSAKRKKTKNSGAQNQDENDEKDETIYDEFTLKYDKTINDNTDEFYSCEIFKNKIRTGFYFSKLHKRYIERLRERFFDTFVLFLCEVKTISKDDKKNLNTYIATPTNIKDEKRKLKLESYVAWTDFATAEKYDVLLLLRSLLSYDSKIMIITNDKIYIHNNFFKYVNELLWSRNSQYSNYGLNYSDYDIDEEGI